MAEDVVAQDDKKPRLKISDEELTSRAIDEIFREVHVAQIRSREFGSDKWAACPLRKTNKRFLCSTLRSVEVHNKRQDRKIKKSSDDQLKQIDTKSDSDHRQSYSERREHKRQRRERSNESCHNHHRRHRRSRESSRVAPLEDFRHHSYPTYAPPSAPYPAQFMYYYPQQVLTPHLPALPVEDSRAEKRTKKQKKKSTETRKRPKKSKTKDKKREKLKKKRKKVKKRKSSISEPEDCYEVVDLTD